MTNQFLYQLNMLLNQVEEDDAKEKIRNRIFQYVGTDCFEELSFTLEDQLFVMFYKLVLIENYDGILDQMKLLDWSFIQRRTEGTVKKVDLLDGQQFYFNVPDTKISPIYEKRLYEEKKSKPEEITMFEIRKIVEEYKSNWEMYVFDTKLKNNQNSQVKINIISNIVDRVTSSFVPTIDRVAGKCDYLSYTEEMYGRSREMAICSEVAFKLGDHELAWCALSKAKEFLGIYVGVRINVENNLKTNIKTIRRLLTSNDVQTKIINFVTNKLLVIKEKGFKTRAEAREAFLNELGYSILPSFKSIFFNSYDNKSINGDNDEEVVNKIINTIKSDKVCKNLFDDIYNSNNAGLEEDKEYYKVPKSDFEKMQKQVASLEKSKCANGEQCPKFIEKTKLNQKILKYLNMPGTSFD